MKSISENLYLGLQYSKNSGGMEYVGSPEHVLKIQGSLNCHLCCENGTYIGAMKKDSLNLAKGNVTVDVDCNLSNQEIIKKIADRGSQSTLLHAGTIQ